MRSAVVTGANSFIGYRLCKILAENDWKVYAVIRRDNANNTILNTYQNIKFVRCSMQDYKNLDKYIPGKCDVGIALAWNGTRGADRNNEQLQKENLHCSIECLESFIRLGCTKILTAGSQAEYGQWTKPRKVTEEDECKPNTEYGRYKHAFYCKALEMCKKKHISLVEPRFFSLYGDDDTEKTMIVSTIRNMMQNKPCELTECVQLWDFLYVDDAIKALYKLIESEKANGVYNFGSGISKPLKEFILEMKTLTKSSSVLKFGAVPYPVTGIVHTNPSIEKLCSDISWKPEVSFSEGINKVIRKQRNMLSQK